MLPATPHSIPELEASQFGHTLQQKHIFLLASPCLIIAKLLYSFHFLSPENSLVLLMQCSNVTLLQAKPDGKFASHTILFDSSSGTQYSCWEAAVAFGARTLGRRSGCYCHLLRTKAYAKHCAWSKHELCIIPLPLGIAGGFIKYLPLLSKGKKVLSVFLAPNHYLFLGLFLFIQPIYCSKTAAVAECDKCQSPWVH